jgi:hypothetical protein
MNQIPVTFQFSGKQYSGSLDQVSGSGDVAIFHLMVDRYYWGRLRFTDQWVFDATPSTQELVNEAEFFGLVVTSWLDSHY